MYKEERDVLEEEMRAVDTGSSEKTIAILWRWWPQAAKQEGDKIGKKVLPGMWYVQGALWYVQGASLRGRHTPPATLAQEGKVHQITMRSRA